MIENTDNNVEVETTASPTDNIADNTPSEISNVEAEHENKVTSDVENKEVINNGVDSKPQYTELEKANYSFHKQLNRQKKKYESLIEEMKKSYEDRFERLEHPEKYAPKQRNDFGTDDEYIRYMAKEQFQDVLKAQMAEYEKQQKELEEVNAQEALLKEEVNRKIDEFYPDEVSKNDFKATIGEANREWDMVTSIDAPENKDLSDFILYSPVGPMIMYELAKNKEMTEDILNTTNPNLRNMKMRNIEWHCFRKGSNVVTNKTEAPVAPTNPIKPVGRPGVQQSITNKPWETKEGLLKLAGV
jgi:hypothetical protein